MEVVGIADAVGSAVEGIREGARVVARLELGGYAEYAVADADEVRLVPDGIGDAETLALVGTAGLTAYAQCAVLDAPDGRPVFLSAAAGGVGSILTQLLKARGWRVLAGVGKRAQSPGTCCKEGPTPPFATTSKGGRIGSSSSRGPRGLAAAFDSVGGAIYRGAFAALGNHGQMVVYGAASGELVGLPPELVFPAIIRCQSVRGNGLPAFLAKGPSTLHDATVAMFEAFREGEINAPETRVYAFGDAAQAHADVEARMTMGKVVLKVAASDSGRQPARVGDSRPPS